MEDKENEEDLETEWQNLQRNARVSGLVNLLLKYKNKEKVWICSICQEQRKDKRSSWLHVAKEHVIGNLAKTTGLM